MPSNDVSIRLAEIEEAEALARLWHRAHLAAEGLLPTRTLQEEAEHNHQILASDGGFGLVVDKHGKIYGMAMVCPNIDLGTGTPTPGVAHVGKVAVTPTMWGKGIGRHLMRAVADQIRERGLGRASLWVRTSNVAARRLYESSTWVPADGAATAPDGQPMMHYELSACS